MYDNYNYPMGADTPDAPWNQEDTPEREFDVDVTFYLSKSMTITTDDYCGDWDVEEDEGYAKFIPDTTNTDWEKAYRNDNFTILQMLDKLKDYVEEEIAQLKERNDRIPYELKVLLESCQGWEERESAEYERS